MTYDDSGDYTAAIHFFNTEQEEGSSSFVSISYGRQSFSLQCWFFVNHCMTAVISLVKTFQACRLHFLGLIGINQTKEYNPHLFGWILPHTTLVQIFKDMC